jgi:hypothetical protein
MLCVLFGLAVKHGVVILFQSFVRGSNSSSIVRVFLSPFAIQPSNPGIKRYHIIHSLPLVRFTFILLQQCRSHLPEAISVALRQVGA